MIKQNMIYKKEVFFFYEKEEIDDIETVIQFQMCMRSQGEIRKLFIGKMGACGAINLSSLNTREHADQKYCFITIWSRRNWL